MNFLKHIHVGLLMVVVSLNTGNAQSGNSSQNTISAKPSKLFHIPFVSSGELTNPVLVLVLHGDAPFNNPSYQYLIAKKIANENSNLVAVGVLRPGYTDHEGNRSEGERGEAIGDNYTRDVLSSIYQLTNDLKKKYDPSTIILVGHSGGAAISANLMSQYPEAYSKSLLISCPCDLHPWRQHMKVLQDGAEIWDIEVSSLSPIEELKNIPDSTPIVVVHGENDPVVPVSIIQNYVAELKANNKNVQFRLLQDQGHEIALNKEIFEIVKGLIK